MKPREEFFGAGAAADFCLGFQHKHLAPTLGEHGRTDQSVMASANDNHIPSGQIK